MSPENIAGLVIAGLLLVYLGVSLFLLTVPLLLFVGRPYLAAVFGDPEEHGAPGPAPGDRVFLPVERAIYRLGRIDPESEQRWTGFAARVQHRVDPGLYVLLRCRGAAAQPHDWTASSPAWRSTRRSAS
jgi:K+-transporting ATPase A subunit